MGARSGRMPWWVYVLRGRDHSRTYVGIALDPAARLQQHNGRRPGGARSTRAGRPWRLAKVYGPYADRGEAQRAEWWLKRRRGEARLHWNGELPPRPGSAPASVPDERELGAGGGGRGVVE